MEENLYREMHDLEASHWLFRARRRIVLSLIKRYLSMWKDSRLLDLGCGTGAMLHELEPLGDIVGMDSSSEALSYASRVTGAELIEGRIPDDLRHIEGGFDCILMLDLLEHLDNDLACLKEVPRLLAPGGFVILTVPAYQWLYAPRDAKHHHRRRYSRRELRSLLMTAGFELELLSYYNTLLFGPAVVVRLLSRLRNSASGDDLRPPSPPVNRILETVLASERFLLPYVSLPFGLSLISVARSAAKELVLEPAPGAASG